MKVTIAGNVKDIKEGTTLAQLVVDEKFLRKAWLYFLQRYPIP